MPEVYPHFLSKQSNECSSAVCNIQPNFSVVILLRGVLIKLSFPHFGHFSNPINFLYLGIKEYFKILLITNDKQHKYLSSPSEVTNKTENAQTIAEPTPKTNTDIKFNQTENTDNNKHTHNDTFQNKWDSIINSKTVTDSIKKTTVRPTNK